MNAEQWARVESHFEALRELPPADRAAKLGAIEDEEIRREVAALLEHASDGQTMAAIVGAVVAQVSHPFQNQERVGPYRIVRRLGHGGQGAVFEAVRDDGVFAQRVAIKIIKWEADDDAARIRFRNERQILAALEHPYIARLLDGGETAAESPYLVMEFVDGRPLAEATQDWTLRRKLDLFLKVADAVAFAHRNLIVHRDLKPANILVTKGGLPKLLDFGIAKLMNENATHTLTGLQAFTPEYASPEQLMGLPITTACDVYSLGVVLYEMLTQRRPYAIKTHSPVEIHQAVCVTEPDRPGLSPDLDNILLMALRKEPERRYASVEQFANDIQRAIDHRPVSARKDTFRYRATRFIQRNAPALGRGRRVAAGDRRGRRRILTRGANCRTPLRGCTESLAEGHF